MPVLLQHCSIIITIQKEYLQSMLFRPQHFCLSDISSQAFEARYLNRAAGLLSWRGCIFCSLSFLCYLVPLFTPVLYSTKLDLGLPRRRPQSFVARACQY